MDNNELNQNVEQNEVPAFTPPTNDSQGADIPTFTPPAPTFKPPKNAKPQFNGPACYYHTDEPAVATCACCGKNICKDCFDNYGVTSGEYAGKALCYDCTQAMVQDNVRSLKKNYAKIAVQFAFSLVGIIIGLIIGISSASGGEPGEIALAAIACAGIGGVFLSALKSFFSLAWDVIKIAFRGQFGWLTILSVIWNILVLVVKCIWYTISNTIYYISYLVKTNGFIKSDTEAIQQMNDYMEYTMVRNKNRGVDLETLMNDNSVLADNSFVRMVQEQGEEQAEANIRGCVATINENGEIIRSFHEAGRTAA